MFEYVYVFIFIFEYVYIDEYAYVYLYLHNMFIYIHIFPLQTLVGRWIFHFAVLWDSSGRRFCLLRQRRHLLCQRGTTLCWRWAVCAFCASPMTWLVALRLDTALGIRVQVTSSRNWLKYYGACWIGNIWIFTLALAGRWSCCLELVLFLWQHLGY